MENKTMPGQVNCAVELPRARTRRINVGGVRMGAGTPVVVQSMLTAPTANPEAAIAQAKDLAEAGCEIVRAANAAAAIAVEGEKTINPDMSADAVQRRMQEQEEFNHE